MARNIREQYKNNSITRKIDKKKYVCVGGEVIDLKHYGGGEL